MIWASYGQFTILKILFIFFDLFQKSYMNDTETHNFEIHMMMMANLFRLLMKMTEVDRMQMCRLSNI
ncbi:hypothetical protein I3760_03G251000 [Carya illinoinensis]|uniref:Uncharacterized protein n=1 Tax=Carya illinoinensis TaxID=32201 RepID=A0A922FNX5_CARIL|nr:hypothetical protein I3760_03G251000 [Carya illinoinensis]KAG6724227.1 hypothetical protein I3842_03G248600 [Carya illinoinensis]